MAIALIFKNKVIYKYNINQDNMLIKNGGYVPHLLIEQHSYELEKIQNKIIDNIDLVEYISVTTGPGLAFSLSVGYRFAVFLSKRFNKPLFFADHIESHILSYRLYECQSYPFTALIISGGHSIIVNVINIGVYKILSRTIDDSVGEVFDKIARSMKLIPQNGLGVELCAKHGNVIPLLNNIQIRIKNNNTNMSFCGIKSKFISIIESKKYNKEDICYTFQHFIAKYLASKLKVLIKNKLLFNQSLIICGGVANNKHIYEHIKNELNTINVETYKVASEIACDNAEMVAWLCYEYLYNKKNKNYSHLCKSKKIYTNLKYNRFIK